MTQVTHRSRNKKYRRVYPYQCERCARKRITFVHARAKAKVCQKCELDHFVQEHQGTMF